MPTTKKSPNNKINLKSSLKEYDAKCLSAQNCLKLLLNHKATPRFIEMVNKIISYFESIEEYEKCKSLKDFLKYNEEVFGNVE